MSYSCNLDIYFTHLYFFLSKRNNGQTVLTLMIRLLYQSVCKKSFGQIFTLLCFLLARHKPSSTAWKRPIYSLIILPHLEQFGRSHRENLSAVYHSCRITAGICPDVEEYGSDWSLRSRTVSGQKFCFAKTVMSHKM